MVHMQVAINRTVLFKFKFYSSVMIFDENNMPRNYKNENCLKIS